MARRVKCHITGEWGTSDVFVKIGKYYYQSQEIYEESQRKKKARSDLIFYICTEFLGYREGQPFPTFLARKLQELSFYDDELILQSLQENASVIHKRYSDLDITEDFGKISYLAGVARNALPELSKRKKSETKRKQATIFSTENLAEEPAQRPTRTSGKDLSAWLDGESI